MTVLLTGATGFLGSRLLLHLLTTRERVVTVLGRGDPSHLRWRVLKALEAVASESIDAPARARLHCAGGDITQPRLGLASAAYGHLAETADAVWHCAGDIGLTGGRERLFRVNVQGTKHVLEFAAATPPECRLVHMSTIAVAGDRKTGRVAESDLTDSHGFVAHYDESKYQAETLVHQWSLRLDRPAVVLRPSIVATDTQLADGAPGHPLLALGKTIATAVQGSGLGNPAQTAQPGSSKVVRLLMPADATFNIIPDIYATEAMLRIGHDAAHDSHGVATFHVAHPVDTAMRLITEVIEARYPGLRLACVDSLPDPTATELLIAAHLRGFLSYSHHTRTYDRTGAVKFMAGLSDPPPIDREYLARALNLQLPQQ
ncbi:SDR family oxidoreductase [Streptomyces klenkii]|uniref:SDR family oxidoreductase n=1 Tax=Streptomyces klenkii TaxID=1420899 RepID=UPI00343E226F